MDIKSKSTLAIYAFAAFIATYIALTHTAQAQESSSQYTDLYISEALPNPTGADSGNEFIEIHNASETPIDLSDISINDRTGRGSYTFAEGFIISPLSYAVLTHSADFTFALNNTGDDIFLTTADGTVIDTLTFTSSTEGKSWNRSEKSSTPELHDPTPGSEHVQETSTQEDLEEKDSTQSDIVEESNNTNIENTTDNASDTENGSAQDNSNNSTSEPITYPAIIISEALPNPQGSDAEGEFIELYNPSNSPQTLTDWTLVDASDKPQSLAELTVPAAGYLILMRSDFIFALNNTDKETITLQNPLGETSDTISFSDTPEGTSQARTKLTTDGNLETTTTPTPGAQNVFTANEGIKVGEENESSEETEDTKTTNTISNNDNNTKADEEEVDGGTTTNITINEVLPNPIGADTTGEYIELHNSNDYDVSIADWSISDASKGAYKFPIDATIRTGEHKTIFRSDFGFALNNTGDETVTLKNAQDEIIAHVKFTAPQEGRSLNFSTSDKTQSPSNTLTPNAPNIIQVLQCAPESDGIKTAQNESEVKTTAKITSLTPAAELPDITLSEIYPNPPGSDAESEFIELYNPSDTEVTLKDWTLSDASAGGRHALDSNDTIAPKSLLTVYRSIFGFALNNTGDETVTLTKPDGSLSDKQTYTNISEGSSYSKIDGVWTVTTTPTPESENIITSQATEQSQSSESASQDSSNQNNAPADQQVTQTGPFAEIILTEVLANPAGEDIQGEFVEFYNPNESTIDLAGWILSDASISGKHTIQDLTVQPQSYSVLYREKSKIALNNSGTETVTLQSPDEKVKSEVTYTTALEDISLSFDRNTGTWAQTTTLTPGEENIFTEEKESDKITDENTPKTESSTEILAIYPAIIISEILPNPDDESSFAKEFIELYNPNARDISLSGWMLKDGSASGKYTFEDDDLIAAGAYIAIEKPTFTFALNNSGEEFLTLIAPNENEKDRVSYSETTKGVSLIRERLDLKENLVQALIPTPGTPNASSKKQEADAGVDSNATTETFEVTLDTYPPLILNEILANPDAETGSVVEYIELYNPTQSTVNLSSWTLKDGSKSGKYTFSDEVIDPGEYKVVDRDTYKFALNNSGTETLSLIDPGEKIASTLAYDTAAKGISYGWTGKRWRFSKTQTPGRPNIFGEEIIITDINTDNLYKDVTAEFEVEFSGADEDDVDIRWDFGNGKKSTKKDTTHKYKDKGTYIASVTVSSNTESTTKQFDIKIKSYPKRKIRITQIMPNPEGKDSGAEYIVITNKDKKKVKLKDWSIATGKDEESARNHPLKKSFSLKPGESKYITKKHSAISLNNSAGYVELRSPTGSNIDDVEYDYEFANTIPEGVSYTKNEKTWTWSSAQKESSKVTPKLSDLSDEEQEAIIARAMANMRGEPVPSNTAKMTTVKKEMIQPTEKSLWEKVIDKARRFFTPKSKEVGMIYAVPKHR